MSTTVRPAFLPETFPTSSGRSSSSAFDPRPHFRARADAAGGHLRILFLGNAYNLLSVACLATLLREGHDVLLVQHDAVARGRLALIARTVRRRGLPVLVRKAARLARCRGRLLLRNVGFAPDGFASLPEFLAVHPLPAVSAHELTGSDPAQVFGGHGVDLIVVASFSRILKAPLIGLPRLGAINVHLSLLPHYRGPAPLYWVLANRERTTGVTIHYVDEGIDSGDVIAQRELEIRRDDSERTLHRRAVALAAELLSEVLPRIADGSAPRVPQDPKLASYYSFPPRGSATLF